MILNNMSTVSIITPTDTHFTNVEPFFMPIKVPVIEPITQPIPCNIPYSQRIIPFCENTNNDTTVYISIINTFEALVRTML